MARFTVTQQTEGALYAALAALFSLASLIPFIGGFFILLSPLPVIVAGIRHGFRLAAVTAVICAVLLFIIVGPAYSLALFLATGGTGLLIVALVRRRTGPRNLVVLGGLGAVVIGAAAFAVSVFLVGVDDPQTIIKTMDAQFETFRGQLTRPPHLGPDGELKAEAKAALAFATQAFEIMKGLILCPIAVIAVPGFFNFLFQYLAAQWILGKLDMELPALAPLRTWYLKPWAALLFLFPMLIPARRISPHWRLNLAFMSLTAFTVMGLAAVSSLLHAFKIPRPARWAAYLFLLFPFVNGITFFIGIIDSVGGFRDPAVRQAAT